MIEALWAALLLVAATHAGARPLALLLALKWAANYAAFRLLGEAAPAFIDLLLGAVGVVWAARHRAWWSDVVAAGFALTLFVHVWYWLPQAAGALSALVYYWLIVGMFSAQIVAVAWPAVRKHGRPLLRRPTGPGPRRPAA